MARAGTQGKLFDTPLSLPTGLVYRPDFLTKAEEEILIAYIANLPLEHPVFNEHEALRRTVGFGWGFDFRNERLVPGPPLPRFLQPLQRKIGKWLDIAPARVAEALVTEYPAKTSIGWHVDNESFEKIIGISLNSWCRMRFRPVKGAPRKENIVSLELEPRSAYIMQGEVRWEWQHSIPHVEDLRYSITFRTLPQGVLR